MFPANNPFTDLSLGVGHAAAASSKSRNFSNASFTSGNPYMSIYPASAASSTPHLNGPGSSDTSALVVYSPNSLYGLYYHEDLHGPFATGRQMNPFTPGLRSLSQLPKPTYVQEDTVLARFPATRSADDPLNWLTEDLLGMSEAAAQASQQRRPLRLQSITR